MTESKTYTMTVDQRTHDALQALLDASVRFGGHLQAQGGLQALAQSQQVTGAVMRVSQAMRVGATPPDKAEAT